MGSSSFKRDMDGVRKGDSDAEGRLVDHFWSTARRIAASEVSDKLRTRVDISDVANDALRSALSEVRNQRTFPSERKEFETLIILKARSRVKDGVRVQLAKKRDARRDEPMGSFEVSEVAADSPESLARGNELAKQMSEIIWRELDPLKALAASLVLIGGWKPVEVSRYFEKELGIQMPAGTIRAVVQAIRHKIIDALRLRENDDD